MLYSCVAVPLSPPHLNGLVERGNYYTCHMGREKKSSEQATGCDLLTAIEFFFIRCSNHS